MVSALASPQGDDATCLGSICFIFLYAVFMFSIRVHGFFRYFSLGIKLIGQFNMWPEKNKVVAE